MTDASIFTKIRLGEVPGEILFQDEDVFVMMTIAPHNPGHCLVVPVVQIDDFEELPDRVYIRAMEIARQMAKVLKGLYGCPKVALAIVGMEVPHAHVHVFPLYDEAEIGLEAAKHPPFEEVQAEARKIRAALRKAPLA